MSDPVLYIFSISHFCEKARWSLDYYGIAYQLEILVPGTHTIFARKLGLPRSSLPILVTGKEVIQGSSAIIDWADQHANTDKPSLNPVDDLDQAADIERRLDDLAGVHLRRLFYSEALVEHPETVKPVFAEGLSLLNKIKLSLMWPIVRKKMIALMDLGAEQGLQSKAILEKELDWLDGLLSGNRPYLIGASFSRVDLTAASLLARLAGPAEHPAQGHFKLPPRAQRIAARWNQRPVMQWVIALYAEHRY
ncbi:MAG: glutathione S-transferase [Gammaproteobacteria bacterium]|nr:glutathione S-transferase [Gammaproteobacteria bacterium]